MTGTFDSPAKAELRVAIAHAFVYMAHHGIDRIELTREVEQPGLRTLTGSIPVVLAPRTDDLADREAQDHPPHVFGDDLTDPTLPSDQGLGGVFHIQTLRAIPEGPLASLVSKLLNYMQRVNARQLIVSLRPRERASGAHLHVDADGTQVVVLEVLNDASLPKDAGLEGVFFVYP